jgi:hypothetical protein
LERPIHISHGRTVRVFVKLVLLLIPPGTAQL